MTNGQDKLSKVPPPPTIASVAPRIAPVIRPVAPVVAPAAVAQPPSNVLAPTGPIEAISPALEAALRAQEAQLNSVDYFQVLKIAQSASTTEIKKAFYSESRVFHPDRFFHLAESPVKQSVGAIYRRMTEAYYVLRDEPKRKKYLVDINGAERAAKLRYTEATEVELKAEARKLQEDEFGTVPKARPFFKTAIAEIEKEKWQSAEQNLKMGLTYEPGNTRFREKLAEVQLKIDESRRKVAFTIK
jgi:hypothetical protein